ncbi:hypothetical protein C8D91_0646 [Marinicella litoralis]|uniref:Uncharacterized protein n=1 Tax=Marinicella litoralis TaxID=644220 RepID=A0A4R6XZ13_9GAMM|nr:hypothetical protein C8D91_0646 [Marinicella litoralis]
MGWVSSEATLFDFVKNRNLCVSTDELLNVDFLSINMALILELLALLSFVSNGPF